MPARLLIIDDEEEMQRLLACALREHELVVMGGAREALALLDAGERFDLILCDLNMPEMDGMEFHAALTPDGRNRVLFVTGGALDDASREFLKQNRTCVLTKPVGVKQLRAAVAAMLEKPA